MTFNRKRGRPRKSNPSGADRGTPELVRVRALSLTVEALDLCYARGLITPDQHWCGVHLRWLFTVRYGAPTLRAVDTLHMGGRDLVMDSPDWRREREREYNEAIAVLGPYAWRLLTLCVYNQRPGFLSVANPSLRAAALRLKSNEKQLDDIRFALDKLVALWCKRKARGQRQ